LLLSRPEIYFKPAWGLLAGRAFDVDLPLLFMIHQ